MQSIENAAALQPKSLCPVCVRVCFSSSSSEFYHHAPPDALRLSSGDRLSATRQRAANGDAVERRLPISRPLQPSSACASLGGSPSNRRADGGYVAQRDRRRRRRAAPLPAPGPYSPALRQASLGGWPSNQRAGGGSSIPISGPLLYSCLFPRTP